MPGKTFEEIEAAAGGFDDDACEICAAHDWAVDNLVAEVSCPFCGTNVLNAEPYDAGGVVGETNYGAPEEVVFKTPIYVCKCGEYYILRATPIIYNGNHDIYLTGGRSQLTKAEWLKYQAIIDSGVGEMVAHVENYIARQGSGEGLRSWHLSHWLAGDAEKFLSKCLFEAGMKK